MPTGEKSERNTLLRFVRRRHRALHHAGRLKIDGLLDAAEFDRELLKERARVDRGGAPFTLLAFTIDAPHADETYAQAAWILAAALNERTRLLDTKGWFRSHIGLILPGITDQNVSKVTANISYDFEKRWEKAHKGTAHPNLHHEVYVYPSDGRHVAIHATHANETSGARRDEVIK